MSDRRLRLSASARVLFAMSGMLATAIALLVVLAYGGTVRALTTSLDRTLRQEAEAYSAAMKGAPAGAGLTDATRAYLGGRTGAEASGLSPILLVRFSSGRVISNSAIRLEDANGSVATSTTSPSLRFVELNGERYRVLATPVYSNSELVGLFEAALAASPVRQTASQVALTLGAAGLLALAVMLPLSYYATRGALSPLARMAADAQTVSHARPGQRIEYNGPRDELGSLADSLNEMLSRLENAFADQRRFVADASHELRTPVAVVRGNVELLRSGRATGEEAEESLEMIEHEAVRMGRLLDELLALARLEDTGRVQFQPLDVQTMLEEVSARAKAFGDRRIECDTTCDLWVEGAPDLLDQALVNLVKNAVSHTREGGTISLNCDSDDDSVRISVTDDGPGIPPSDLGRVFDRFYRAQGGHRNEASGGAGLGLAITQRLIQLHGGSVRAENVQPHGARFVVELPRATAPSGG